MSPFNATNATGCATTCGNSSNSSALCSSTLDTTTPGYLETSSPFSPAIGTTLAPSDLLGLSQHLSDTFNSSFFYLEPYFSDGSCAESRSWKELTVRDDFFTGGLGGRMVLDVVEVWGCFERHPCLEAVKRAVMVTLNLEPYALNSKPWTLTPCLEAVKMVRQENLVCRCIILDGVRGIPYKRALNHQSKSPASLSIPSQKVKI